MTDSLFKPEDYGIPSHFRHWQGDTAEDVSGPFFYALDDESASHAGTKVQTAFRVRPENCNSHKTAHGGMLMMFADYTLCIAAISGTHEGVVTVSCNNEFVGPAVAGDLVLGRGEVMRKGGSLVFVRAVLEVNGKVVLTSSGVVKRIRRAGGATSSGGA